MGQRRIGVYPGERYGVGDEEEEEQEEEDKGPKVACPFCDFLIPLRWAISPDGRQPLTCPRCEREVSLPGEPD